MKNFKGRNDQGGSGFRKGSGGREFNHQNKRSADFQPRGKQFGSNTSFGGDRNKRDGFRNSEARSSELFSAVCSKCGKNCEVPFRPSGDKPVYCSACFGKKSQDESREFKGDDRGNSLRTRFEQREERPVEGARGVSITAKQHDALVAQVGALEGKINKVLSLLLAETEVTLKVEKPVATEVVQKAKKARKLKTQPVDTVSLNKAIKKAVKGKAQKNSKSTPPKK